MSPTTPDADLPRPDRVVITADQIEELLYHNAVYVGEWTLMMVPGQGLQLQDRRGRRDTGRELLTARHVPLPNPLVKDVTERQYAWAAQKMTARFADRLAEFAASEDLRTHPETARPYHRARTVASDHSNRTQLTRGWKASHAHGRLYIAADHHKALDWEVSAVETKLAKAGLTPVDGPLTTERVCELEWVTPRYPDLVLDLYDRSRVGWLARSTDQVRDHAGQDAAAEFAAEFADRPEPEPEAGAYAAWCAKTALALWRWGSLRPSNWSW